MDTNRVGARGGNISYTRAASRAAQITGHYNEYQLQNTVQFTVDGVFYTLAPVDNQAITGNVITGCNECIFALWVNNTNVLAWTQGKIVDPAKVGGAGGLAQQAIPFPDVVSGNALVALMKLKVGTAGSFTPGTTNLNATNITATFFDVTAMPVAPQQS